MRRLRGTWRPPAATGLLAAALVAPLAAGAGAGRADAPPSTAARDLSPAAVALVVPSAPAPVLAEDGDLAEAAGTLQPYRVYRVEAFEPAAAFPFDPPQALRLPPPPTATLVSSAVDARAPDVTDPARPRSVSGALTVAPPPTQVWRLKAGLDVQAGDRPDPAVAWPGAPAPTPAETPWRRVGGAVDAGLNLSSQAALDLSLSRALEVQDLPDRPDGAAAQNSRQQQRATVSLSVAPLRDVRLGLSARADEVDDAVSRPDDAAAGMILRTSETTAGLSAAWTLGPAVRLEASDRLGYAGAAWRETAATSQTYAISEPDLVADLRPWAGGDWRLSFGHAVSPLDLGAFAAVAQGLQRAADLGAGVRLAPNQEWRTRAQVNQALPGHASLGLTLTEARLDTTQELARNLDGADLPVSIAGGERRQLDLSLTAPLSALALDSFTLQTTAAVRDSQITDPVTGLVRRLSGEAPYDASITLAQEVAPLSLRWGVQGRAQGAQVYYTPEQTSTAAPARSLGLFVEYHPAPFALRLQVDGVAGGARDITDALYDGSRDSDRIVRIDHRLDGGPAFSLVLRKAL